MAIQKTTVVVEASGELRVEISVGDVLDTDDARQGIRFVVVVPPMAENPGLSAIQIAAMNRARALLDQCVASLAPRTSAD
jgi:hypothetical protein